jgi:hypothetical protein
MLARRTVMRIRFHILLACLALALPLAATAGA